MAGTTSTDGRERPGWADEANLDAVGLVARLLRIHLLFERLLDAATESAGISAADYLVLALVERSVDGGSPTHIAQVLRRSTGGMTLTIDRLESLGWLERIRDDADRRRIRLQLTEAGDRAIERVRAALHGWEDALELDPADHRSAHGAADELIALLSREPVTLGEPRRR